MRSLTFISLLIIGLGFTSTKNTTMQSNRLNGTWVPVEQEMGGAPLPKASMANQKLVLSDSTYTFTAESIDKGVVKYNDDKIDIYGKEGPNAGKHITAIYKMENGQLTICYNLAGDAYPAAFETKSKAMLFLCVFKKEDPAGR